MGHHFVTHVGRFFLQTPIRNIRELVFKSAGSPPFKVSVEMGNVQQRNVAVKGRPHLWRTYLDFIIYYDCTPRSAEAWLRHVSCFGDKSSYFKFVRDVCFPKEEGKSTLLINGRYKLEVQTFSHMILLRDFVKDIAATNSVQKNAGGKPTLLFSGPRDKDIQHSSGIS